MSFRILILGLAVTVCALWPQGLVLCLGEPGHVELERGGTPCCPADHSQDEDEDHEDCADCRDFESPELTSASPAPVLPAPYAQAVNADFTPDAYAASVPADLGRPPLSGVDDLRTVILVV